MKGLLDTIKIVARVMVYVLIGVAWISLMVQVWGLVLGY